MADKDSEAKRRSGTGFWLSWILPDGTIAQGDRQHKGGVYSGINKSAPGGFQVAWVVKNTHVVGVNYNA